MQMVGFLIMIVLYLVLIAVVTMFLDKNECRFRELHIRINNLSDAIRLLHKEMHEISPDYHKIEKSVKACEQQIQETREGLKG